MPDLEMVSTYFREQSLNMLESVIRRLFVRTLFSRSESVSIFMQLLVK
jgi:hypothetical protein